MLRLLERTIASLDQRLLLLAPGVSIPPFFENVANDETRHRGLMRDMQKLRGSVYLDDGALHSAQLTTEGLHETPEDDKSWHLLMVDSWQRVTGCVWFLEHNSHVRVEISECGIARLRA